MKFHRAFLLALVCSLWIAPIWAASGDDVVVYPAFIVADTAVIEGRVVEHRNRDAPARDDGKGKNLRRILSLMINDERKNYPVTVTVAGYDWPVRTDREGYFRVDAIGMSALAVGWHDVTATTAAGAGQGQLFKLPEGNTHGIISDIDDTILVTEVNSKRRLLANTFFYNAIQRQAVPGVADLYKYLAGANTEADYPPIIYLSASPQQLYTSIAEFLEKNEFPRGVLITKRVTDDRTSEPLTDQVRYKTAKIEAILASWPQVVFTLVGDDGEYDPEIYADIAHRFPSRIAATLIRKVNPNPARAVLAGQGDLDAAIQQMREQQGQTSISRRK